MRARFLNTRKTWNLNKFVRKNLIFAKKIFRKKNLYLLFLLHLLNELENSERGSFLISDLLGFSLFFFGVDLQVFGIGSESTTQFSEILCTNTNDLLCDIRNQNLCDLLCDLRTACTGKNPKPSIPLTVS